MLKRNLRNKGFTLIETIVYAVFVAILTVVTIQALTIAMNSFYKLRLVQNVDQSATVGLERMSREIRNAYSIDTTQSTFDTNPGRLTLLTKDQLGMTTTIEFYVSGSDLRFKQGGVDMGSLLTKNAVVSNLIFKQIANPNSRAVKIEMTLGDTRGTLQNSENFYNTVILRGSTE